MILIKLLTPLPALLVENDEKVIIVADLHIGIEYELSKMGINIPYQTESMLKNLLQIIKQQNPDRLIILGDVKHGVPITSFIEKKELPSFFEVLLKEVPKIDITRGNHDGKITEIVPKEITIHNSYGFVIGSDYKVALFHGHAWLKPKMLDADLIIAGHNHPTILLKTPLGIRISQRVWLKGLLDPQKLVKAYLNQNDLKIIKDPVKAFNNKFNINIKASEVILMPTFNDLLGGLPVNGSIPQNLLGPMLRREIINFDDFEVYLLDGTYLGKVDFLKRLNN
ncbi:metallophosphoesterase [Candidatus Bathyarchaeota archaeon]|nr:metallophosphoesterase [Candidatus Bathyarchaeota archaeon]